MFWLARVLKCLCISKNDPHAKLVCKRSIQSYWQQAVQHCNLSDATLSRLCSTAEHRTIAYKRSLKNSIRGVDLARLFSTGPWGKPPKRIDAGCTALDMGYSIDVRLYSSRHCMAISALKIPPRRISWDILGILVVITPIFAHGCAGIRKWFSDGIRVRCLAMPLC